MDMEEYSDAIRFIITANSQHRVIPPLQDRCTVIGLKEQNREKYLLKLISILEQENIAITDENMVTLDTITERHWPSLRSGIRDLQKYCMSGELTIPENNVTKNDDLYEKVYTLFKTQKIRAARELLCSSLTKEDIEGAYVWFYQHMELFTNKDESIIAINEGLKAHGYVADPEINLSATLTKLALLND
jgi:DNA polymerase III delta prime subunit